MRGGGWDGDKAIGIETLLSESTGLGPSGQTECSQLYTDCWDVWPQLFLQGPPQETNVPSLHAYLADLASPPIRYGLHQRGKKCGQCNS